MQRRAHTAGPEPRSISLCRPSVELQNVDEDIRKRGGGRKSHPKVLFNHGNLDLPWLH